MVNTVLTISGEADAVVEMIKRLAFAGAGAAPAPAAVAALPPTHTAETAEQTMVAAEPASAPAATEPPRWRPDLVGRILNRVTDPARWMIERMLLQPNYIIDIDEVGERLDLTRRNIGGVKRSIGAAQNQLAPDLPPVVIVYGRNRMGLSEDFAAAMTKLKEPAPPPPSRYTQWEQLTAE